MQHIDTYKGIKIFKGFRGASTISTGTHRNAGKKSKTLLDSIVYTIEGDEYSFSISRGADYEDYKSITREDIDLKIKSRLPRL